MIGDIGGSGLDEAGGIEFIRIGMIEGVDTAAAFGAQCMF